MPNNNQDLNTLLRLDASPPRNSEDDHEECSAELNTFGSSGRFMADNKSLRLVHVNDSVVLTEKEQLIFDLLLKVERHYGLETEIRVAGGWVRDKLLGMDSNDIDIALHNLSGRDFCIKMNEYLYSIGEKPIVAHVIPANEKKLKNLEITRMQIDGTWIDFVYLTTKKKTEIENENANRFGSPGEDAYLRDLTINSLFYRITNHTVEDFTGRGIDDLMYGRIVTPSPPEETLLDDPLRVLRAIRFGAKFGFTLDEELKIVAASNKVKTKIANNVSRERIGHEVDLMICDKDPAKAIAHIYELSLFYDVFAVPSKFEPTLLLGFDRLCVANIDFVTSMLKLLEHDAFNDGDRRLLLYAALLLPFRKLTHKNKKSIEIPLVNYIFQDSLKLKMDDAKAVVMIHTAAERFASLTPYLLSGEDIDGFEVLWIKEQIDIPSSSKLRAYAGILLDEIKCLWRVSLLVSTLLYPATIDLEEYTNGSYDLIERKQIFTTIEDKIIKLGLKEVGSGNLKPLVDGKDIMNALGLNSGSSIISQWQRKVRQWQLAHPLATKDECARWIEEEAHSKRVKTACVF